ncbi:hypothetical protein [Nocardioides convexus]|nr:hypothetical protein [Nocardioides convexus]
MTTSASLVARVLGEASYRAAAEGIAARISAVPAVDAIAAEVRARLG